MAGFSKVVPLRYDSDDSFVLRTISGLIESLVSVMTIVPGCPRLVEALVSQIDVVPRGNCLPEEFDLVELLDSVKITSSVGRISEIALRLYD